MPSVDVEKRSEDGGGTTSHDPSPATEEPLEPAGLPSEKSPTRGEAEPEGLTRAGAAWVATGVSLVLLVLLIVFILQNQTKVGLKFLGFDGEVPVGVAMLIAAVTGGALVAIAGVARVLQLRRALHRTRDQRAV